MSNRDIIVIGGSSGATTPLRTILAALPADLPAAVLIVLHVPARSRGLFATVTAAAGRLPVHPAAEGLVIEPGHVYLGVPDHHLLVDEGRIRLGRGPHENMARPAIDPLFRSAAAAYGPRVIGVLLSGLLNDGASGLEAIKRCGGVTLVQDPAEATAAEMPRSGLSAVEVDRVLPAARIGDVLGQLVRGPAGPTLPVPPELRLEIAIAAGEWIGSAGLRRVADTGAISSRSSGGVPSPMRDARPLRLRGEVGHADSAEAPGAEQEGAVDAAMRVALRIIEERAELVARMAEGGRQAGRPAVSTMFDARAAEYRRYAATLRRALLRGLEPVQADAVPPAGDESPGR